MKETAIGLLNRYGIGEFKWIYPKNQDQELALSVPTVVIVRRGSGWGVPVFWLGFFGVLALRIIYGVH